MINGVFRTPHHMTRALLVMRIIEHENLITFLCFYPVDREILLELYLRLFRFLLIMPTYTSAQPELFTNPPEKSSSARKKGQLTDEQVQQYFSEVVFRYSTFSETWAMLILSFTHLVWVKKVSYFRDFFLLWSIMNGNYHYFSFHFLSLQIERETLLGWTRSVIFFSIMVCWISLKLFHLDHQIW